MARTSKFTSVELRRRARAYRTAKTRALETDDADARLFWIAVAATIAWLYHFDLWADAEVDSAIDEIASALFPPDLRIAPEPGRTTHLTSTVMTGGGHAELLLFWCDHVGDAVISTELYDLSAARDKGTISPSLPVHRAPRDGTPTERASWTFRQLLQLRPARLILHLNPNDVIGILACLLYRKASGAELIVYDHADTFYWLGASLADRVIVLRPAGAAVARARRGITEDKLALVPLTSRARHSPDVTRASLGVPDNATVSLTVAAFYKMRPASGWDYAMTIGRILRDHRNHHHLIVGVGSARDEAAMRAALANDRVHFLGKRTDVDALLRASDFVIESFPLMGGLVRFDAAREGRVTVAVAPSLWPLIYDMGSFPPDYRFVAHTPKELEHMTAELIANPKLRRETGRLLQDYYEENFSSNAAAEAMRAALAGRTMQDAPEGPLEYDTEPFTMLVSPAPLNVHTVVEMVKSNLGYAPPKTLVDHVQYLAGYTREAVKARLGHRR